MASFSFSDLFASSNALLLCFRFSWRSVKEKTIQLIRFNQRKINSWIAVEWMCYTFNLLICIPFNCVYFHFQSRNFFLQSSNIFLCKSSILMTAKIAISVTVWALRNKAFTHVADWYHRLQQPALCFFHSAKVLCHPVSFGALSEVSVNIAMIQPELQSLNSFIYCVKRILRNVTPLFKALLKYWKVTMPTSFLDLSLCSHSSQHFAYPGYIRLESNDFQHWDKQK